MTEPQKRWPGFNYEPVPGLMNRHISRYLRTQRKNMLRFFQERGLYVLAERMSQIRKSRQGMMAKNRMFQGVLNDYAALTMPARAPVPGQVEPLQTVRAEASEGVAATSSGESEISLDGVAQTEPGANAGDSVQGDGVPNTNPADVEDL